MYFLVEVSSTVRCRRAGKYEAKRLQNLLRLKNSDRRDNVPEVASLLKMSVYMRYGMRSGHASGMAQSRKKIERKMGIDMVCQSTAIIWRRRCNGTFSGAQRILLKYFDQSMVRKQHCLCEYSDAAGPCEDWQDTALQPNKVQALTQIAASQPQHDGRSPNVTFHSASWRRPLFVTSFSPEVPCLGRARVAFCSLYWAQR